MNSSDTKPIFYSKTAFVAFLTTIVGGIAAFNEDAAAKLSAYIPHVLIFIGVLNIVLRKITKGAVTFVGSGDGRKKMKLPVLSLVLLGCLLLPLDGARAGTAPVAKPVEIDAKGAFDKVSVFSMEGMVTTSTYVFFTTDGDDFGAGFRTTMDITDSVKLRGDYQTTGFKFDGDEFGSDASLTLQFSYPIKGLPAGLEPYAITGTSIQSFDEPNISALIGAGLSYDVHQDYQAFVEYEFSNEDSASTVLLGFTYKF